MKLQKTKNTLEKETENLDLMLFDAQGKGCFERYAEFQQLKEDIEKKLTRIIEIRKEHYESVGK